MEYVPGNSTKGSTMTRPSNRSPKWGLIGPEEVSIGDLETNTRVAQGVAGPFHVRC